MQIAPSVYFYPFTSFSENNCNSIIIDGPEKVLIDPGHKHLWPQLVRQIEADGLSPADISLVLHTHCHPDHMEAGEILEFEYGATQAMSGIEAEFLNEFGRDFFPWMGLDYPQGSLGRQLEPGPLNLGDKTLELYLSPGHTPGSLCLHWPEAKVLISGDVIFAHSVGRSDFKGGDHQALAGSIARLAALPDVDILLPGHGPSIIGADKVAANFQAVKAYFR
ncbi:MAG: MBL fold metallo-hydrolase [Candidatus Adiutrix sp.]|jgi:glyoxylase-like metal-dependent hydrolase (beta-lactamase superfamily II)|nr:MBL fold metallo-hydrolase [Candidatus Adiutrix sp.]